MTALDRSIKTGRGPGPRLQYRFRRAAFGLTAIAAITVVLTYAAGANPTTAGFGYLIAVLLIAARWGMVESVAAALGAAFCLNYFFLPPVGTLHIREAHDWVALFAFLVTSLVAGQLSELARRRNAQLDHRQEEMERLYALSRGILSIDHAQSAPTQIADEIVRIYAAESAVLYDQESDQIFMNAGAAPHAGALAMLRETTLSRTASNVPGKSAAAPIALSERPIGAVVVYGASVSESALSAMTNLIAVGLEKARSRELANRAEAARQSEQFKSALLDAVAHELKTPLTSIKAATSAILTTKTLTAAEQTELLSVIEQESERLSVLVNEALHLARIESAKLHLARTRQEIPKIVDEAIRQSASVLGNRRVETSFGSPLPAIHVDAELFILALRQLLDNAVKYSPASSAIRIVAETSADAVRIRIHNGGPAISEKERALVFERFYRTPAARWTASGTGMGLAIVQDIVRAHGGHVDVESEPGAGTEFSIRLPLAKGTRS